MLRHPPPKSLLFLSKELEVFKRSPVSPRLDVFCPLGRLPNNILTLGSKMLQSCYVDVDIRDYGWELRIIWARSWLVLWQWWYRSCTWYEQCPSRGTCRVSLWNSTIIIWGTDGEKGSLPVSRECAWTWKLVKSVLCFSVLIVWSRRVRPSSVPERLLVSSTFMYVSKY